MRRPLAPTTALALLPTLPVAHDPALEIVVLVREGDLITGVGAVTSVQNVLVNDQGDTLVLVDTDHADTNADECLLVNGALVLREGDALAAPAGATVDFFDTLVLSDAGVVTSLLRLDGTAGSADDAGVFFDGGLVLQEGSTLTAPGVTPGTPVGSLYELAANDTGTVLVDCLIDDPAIAGTLEGLLLLVDAATGAQQVAAQYGHPAPGFPGATYGFFSDSPGSIALNDGGSVMFQADTDLPDGNDGVIYLDTTPLAQEGTPSVVPGRNWSNLTGPVLDLNDDGDHVFSGRLDGDFTTRDVLVVNGEKLVQTGDDILREGVHNLTFFGTGPVVIANRGEPGDDDPDVLWNGFWNEPGVSKGLALFLNRTALLNTVGDVIEGLPITGIQQHVRGYSMSDSGRHVAVEVTLEGGIEVALSIDRGPWRSTGSSLAGTSGAPRLRAFGQLAADTPMTVRLTDAAPSSLAFLVMGVARADTPLFGGTLVPTPDAILHNLPTDAHGALELPATWPAGVPAGIPFYLQAWVADPGAPKDFAASNGVVGTAQ